MRDKQPTSKPYLHLIPYCCPSGKPAYFSADGYYDLIYADEVATLCKTYKEVNGVLVIDKNNVDSSVEPVRLSHSILKEGAFIKVGTVISKPGNVDPIDTEIEMGMRTLEGYKKLINTCELEINVCSNPL